MLLLPRLKGGRGQLSNATSVAIQVIRVVAFVLAKMFGSAMVEVLKSTEGLYVYNTYQVLSARYR